MIEARFCGRLGGFQLDAELSAPSRGVTALLGPSGSGKTTLLRCIAGLHRLPGRLSVDGQTWQDEASFLPAHRRPIGYVFQEPSLLPHLSVKGNLAYGFRRSGQAKIGWDETVALLGLEPLLGRSTEKLSGGQRQRVAIGRALLAQPQLLLLDEPLSSLDRDAKAEILPYLERLHDRLEIPIVYVSHDPAEIGRMADHLLVMEAGRIVASTPAPAADGLHPTLAGLDEDHIRRLALAAIAAGLDPLQD